MRSKDSDYHISIQIRTFAYPNQVFAEELKQPDPHAATRRAIVRAAAEIGESM